MRTYRRLFAIAILLTTQFPSTTVSAFAGPTDESKRTVRATTHGGGSAARSTPRGASDTAQGIAARRERPKLLDAAYADALRILGRDNSCSRFLGGSGAAEETLGHLMNQLRDGLIR